MDDENEDTLEDSNDWSDYDSGPFCQHFSTPYDCMDICICGHACSEHDREIPYECNNDDCNCSGFADVDGTDED